MAVGTLTEKQAEALTLVHQGYETKEIARLLHIAPSTVDQRIDGARRRLGVATRAQAARIFAAQGKIPKQSIYEPFPLTPHGYSASVEAPPRDELQFQDAIFDDRANWDRGSLWHLPRIAPRDLGKTGRVLVVLALFVLMLVGAGEAVDLFGEIGAWSSR